MNVLIVDDNPISAKVLAHTLDKHGYETLTACDGEQALEYLESYPDIDLVITDIVMPKTDGVELVRRIKERPEWSEIPILVCTSTQTLHVDKRLPAMEWKMVFKPISADILVAKVKEACAEQRMVLPDPDQTLSQTGLDSRAVHEVVEEFLKVVKDKIPLLEQKVKEASKDPLDLRELLEGATLIRAERVMDILNQLNQREVRKNPEMPCSIYPSLLRELKAVQRRLTLYLR